jgi:hypothetical protein
LATQRITSVHVQILKTDAWSYPLLYNHVIFYNKSFSKPCCCCATSGNPGESVRDLFAFLRRFVAAATHVAGAKA